MIDVVALGELLIDFAAKSTDSAGYPTMAANPGGAPGNFLAALNAYGRKTAFLGKVGNDAFGNLLLGTLNAAGIETKGILVDDSVFTTLAFVTFDESGDRAFSFARKPGADTQLRWEEVDKSLIDEAKVFHFGTLSLTDEPVRTATQKAVAYAKAQGKLISCDPNLRLPLWPDADAAKEQMLWSLRQADVVKISDNEVEFLWNCTPEEGADKLLTEFGVSLAMVTLGPDGCLLKTRTAAFRAVCVVEDFDSERCAGEIIVLDHTAEHALFRVKIDRAKHQRPFRCLHIGFGFRLTAGCLRSGLPLRLRLLPAAGQQQAEQQHENQTAFHDAFLLIFLPVYHSFSLKSLNFS